MRDGQTRGRRRHASTNAKGVGGVGVWFWSDPPVLEVTLYLSAVARLQLHESERPTPARLHDLTADALWRHMNSPYLTKHAET